MTRSLEPWNGQVHPVRATRRAVSSREQQWVLDALDDQHNRITVATRLEGGALLSGQLNQWIGTLGHQQTEAEMTAPHSARRISHVIDALAMNGASIIGSFIRGEGQ